MKMPKKHLQSIILCLIITLSSLSIPFAINVNAQESYFHVTLMVPEPNTSRQAWALVIEDSFKAAGISTDRVILDWDTIYDRALIPPDDLIGKTYDEGGFDMLFIGFAAGIDPEPFSLYHSSQFAPYGQNYVLWNNSENDRLCSLISETVDESTRLNYVKEWQQLANEEVPALTIFYTEEIVAFDPTALNGDPFKVYHYPVWPATERWELNPSSSETKIVMAQTGPCPEEGLNPWITTSYYDLAATGVVTEGLAVRNDTDGKKMLPALATDWEVAEDGKTWTVHLRQDVTWQDGEKFNATDVKFSYASAMNEELASPIGAFVQSIVGTKDNIEIVDEYTVIFHLPEVYAYFVENILAAPGYGYMIPWHVLKDVPYADWRTHPFNTADGSYVVDTPNGEYTAYGPIGTGPYIYAAYDPTTFTNVLTRNDNYWNNQTLWDQGLFGITEYYVQFIEGPDAAISALKAGTVDVLDSQYQGIETKLDSIEQPWGDYISYDAFGIQECGLNMQHPIFGTGVDTPLGKSDPSRAAEAARYVRQALNHLIPRQTIIDTIVGGYGAPGVTSPITKVTAGYDASIQPYSYDVQAAKNLLAKAGYGASETTSPSESTSPTPSGSTEPSFLDQYGLYIAVAIAAIVVVALGAIYMIRKRKP